MGRFEEVPISRVLHHIPQTHPENRDSLPLSSPPSRLPPPVWERPVSLGEHLPFLLTCCPRKGGASTSLFPRLLSFSPCLRLPHLLPNSTLKKKKKPFPCQSNPCSCLICDLGLGSVRNAQYAFSSGLDDYEPVCASPRLGSVALSESGHRCVIVHSV